MAGDLERTVEWRSLKVTPLKEGAEKKGGAVKIAGFVFSVESEKSGGGCIRTRSRFIVRSRSSR